MVDDKKRFFHAEEADYIFEREDNGNDQMICEVRGVGAGLYDRNKDMLLECLNEYPKVKVQLEDLHKALASIPKNVKWLPFGGDPNCGHAFTVGPPSVCVKCGAREKPECLEAKAWWPREYPVEVK